MNDDAVPLDELGWHAHHAGPPSVSPGEGVSRVVVEHRGAYELLGPYGLLEAAVDPSLRAGARDALDFPAVGDWVEHSLDPRHDRRVLISKVEERTSAMVRRAPGPEPVPQVVAANVDVLCVVTTPNEDLNERRIERYLVAALGSGARPVLVVNKSDLDGGEVHSAELGVLADAVEIVATSAVTGAGLDVLRQWLATGLTLAFTGSSGVGKSSIVNRLLDSEVLATGAVRADGKGRHTTIRRELLLVPGGGVVIDTPGLREVQLWDDGGLELAFPEITELAADCRFSDCQHSAEPGCAVRDAVEGGRLTARRVEAYGDLAAELAELQDEVEERERAERRRRDARARSGRSGRPGGSDRLSDQ